MQFCPKVKTQNSTITSYRFTQIKTITKFLTHEPQLLIADPTNPFKLIPVCILMDILCFLMPKYIYADTVFRPPSICVLDLENVKNMNFSPRGHGNIQIKVTQPIRASSTQSTLLGQIDLNAPSQPWIDRKSKLVNIIPK